MMKWIYVLLCPVFLLAGCMTTSTIDSRKQGHAAAYAALSPEFKTLVDQGQIAVGMPSAAVTIAWGPPDDVLQNGNRNGVFTTWLYRGSFFQETRYWAGRRHPYLAYDYEPRTYVRAEIVFSNGAVQSWRTLPPPGY